VELDAGEPCPIQIALSDLGRKGAEYEGEDEYDSGTKERKGFEDWRGVRFGDH
jgi:hypothetical protein